MNCKDANDRLVDLVLGRVDDADRAALDEHLARCESCRRARDETLWLVESMRARRTEVDAAHLAPQILYEFAAAPGAFDASKTASIEEHVAHCPSCASDLQAVRELQSLSIQPQPARKPRRRVWRALVPVAVAAAAVIVVIARWGGKDGIRIVSPGSVGAGASATELHLTPTTRFSDAPAPGAVESRGDRQTILAVDLSFVDGLADTYTLIIRDDAGKQIASLVIPRDDVDAGRTLVRLRAGALAAGEYHLEVVAEQSGVFEVVGDARLRILE